MYQSTYRDEVDTVDMETNDVEIVGFSVRGISSLLASRFLLAVPDSEALTAAEMSLLGTKLDKL